ncbi:glycoside hydrolase family 65 protein [Nocardia sp. BMG51109]|uniref:glycoside hydrolase family 65 protein n=1 Tax=Nocardia sp. BMG51109 TaxID=1056816 RepID=UPI00046442C9|nr:glycoside hydrolase family 65 protein [Nocardia sp. BMG51109]
MDRIVTCVADSPDRTGTGRVLHSLRHAWRTGVDGLLAAHRDTWARRWRDVGIELPDDPETELAVRFALFQLWCNTGSIHGESAVGARGISGPGYRGHIFWDSDVFVLPALVSIDTAAAGAMVAYRVHRLDAARKRARSDGRRGARFPWESAADGTDVTPRSGYLGGVPVPILTGTREEHITADIAWAAHHYAEWSGTAPARELLTETARYWASRARTDRDGRGHIDGVIGPDEYHEYVDDNAYTNVMARWNLRRAARLAPRNTWEAEEFEQWNELADGIVDQLYSDGRYEQFTGYFDLEPLTAAAVAGRPVAADVLLGQARVAGSQLIKQPDVLMLHHLVPEEVAPGSLVPNLEFYGPRTTHGSSLSPAIMAALLARAGRADEALEMLRPALRLDLDDRTATTAAGLHMATLGGVWQALLVGFAGPETVAEAAVPVMLVPEARGTSVIAVNYPMPYSGNR